MLTETCMAGDMTFARRSQMRTVRELWNLREQARVRAAEDHFLRDLQNVISAHVVHSVVGRAAHEADSELSSDESVSPTPFPSSAPDDNRYRERAVVMEEVRALNRRHHVQRLNRFFDEVSTPGPVMVRSSSWGSELAEARTVTNALDSEFRHHLEHVVTRRGTPWRRRHIRIDENQPDPAMYANGSLQAEIERIEREEDQIERQGATTWMGDGMDNAASMRIGATVRNLEEEVAQLRNAVAAGFDIQLDIQRAIRQEVAAALSRDATSNATTSAYGHFESKARKSGRCTICLEQPIDSLLYSCGHMCTCSACGRGLLTAGQKCPICRAPVRDIVRVYVVNETG